MIVTVTLNAALDVTYRAPRLRWGHSNRVEAHYGAGGKGVNAARVIRRLGAPVVVTGLAGGLTGDAIRADLARAGINQRLAPIAAESRRNVATVSVEDAVATEFIESGPSVDELEWRNFLDLYGELLGGAQATLLSGSMPPDVPTDGYARLCRMAAGAGTPALLDTSGPALLEGLDGKPAVVKPNLRELEEATGRHLPWDDEPSGEQRDQVVAAAQELRRRGADAAVVTLGPAGILAVTPAGVWAGRAPAVTGNSVGAGDAVAASLAVGVMEHGTWPEQVRTAAAVAAASVLHPLAGGFDDAAYPDLLRRATVEQWS